MAKAIPLVDGYLERISAKAFQKYYHEIAELVRTQHGVYALYKNDRLYYVGLASNLRRRIKQHLRSPLASRWNRFSLYLVRKVDHIKEIESLLLRIADPAGNRQCGRLRKATNLRGELRHKMEERQRTELDEIMGRATESRRKERRKTRRAGGRNGARPGGRAVGSLKGILGGGKRLYATFRGKKYKAVVRGSGFIKFDGKLFGSPSSAARAITNKASNGWRFWHFREGGELKRLSELRR